MAGKACDSKGLPKFVEVSPGMAGKWGAKASDMMIIPAPFEVDGVMKKEPEGRLITMKELKQALIRKAQGRRGCNLLSVDFRNLRVDFRTCRGGSES